MDWMMKGVCSAVGPHVFFPRSHDSSMGKIAAGICEKCPVLDECREHGIKHERYGIWGGLTPNQRARIRKAKRIPLEEISKYWWLS